MTTVQDIYELSPMQQGMLFHTLYAPESGVYFEQRNCLLAGPLDVAAFKRAWQTVVERHAVLRTAFYWEEADKPLQVVYASAELPWIEADWQALSESEQREKLAAFLQGDRTQGFHLDQPPLMRCALFQLSPDQHHFVWSHHHLLMDGWCNALLIKEVLAFYTAQRQGETLTLAPPRPYRDYILWLQQQDQQAARTYWQQALADFTAPTPLGIDRSRLTPTTPHSEHCDQWHTLPQPLTADLHAFAQRHHLTLNTLFQGAWARVLSCYSGSSDVVFGATVAGRPPTLPGSDSIVGLFINTVPVRVAMPPAMPLLQWLQRIQAAQRDHETYAFSSLTDIQSWRAVPHGTPLFESLLVFENYPVSLTAALTDDSSDLTVEAGQGFEQTNYPLALVVIPGKTLALRVNYDLDRFSNTAIQRLLGHLETVLAGIMAAPEASTGQLPLLTQEEQQQLITWNQTEQLIPDRCVHELIADQATVNPNATALIFEDTVLSYQELDQRANQLAYYLMQQGVQRGDRVALCLDRSAELVITLLAILKTGATYIPLDPTYPMERLRFILEDAQVSLLITAPGAAEAIPKTAVPTLDLSERKQAAAISLAPLPFGPHSPTANDLAYLIYTSGSTGTPKGVPIQYQSLTNLLASMAQAPGMMAQDTLLAVTTPAFDIAALELFLPLTVGGTLVIASQDTVRDPQSLATQLEHHDVTLMQATPATWRLLVESGWQGKSNLKLLCGGEALEPSLAQRLLDCGAELWNLYGPTETTIWSAALKLDASILADGLVPIGPPIANTQFHVLDAQQRPVPRGVSGELYIGGLGLSSGYWQREDLTAERFIDVEGRRQKGIGNREQGTGSPQSPERGQTPSPVRLASTMSSAESSVHAEAHSPIHPSILYKTGDRVRTREDGTLEYLGRLDHQVKLRGFRIELGEIEAVLTQHPDVSQAVVVLREDTAGESQLVAYCVKNAKPRAAHEEHIPTSTLQTPNSSPHPPIPSSPHSLPHFLSQHLPAYMVPTQFVVLDALPLTPNGKVDRNALPTPDSPEISHGSTAPRTLTEELLANIWTAVLDQSQVSRADNFFELGGHSLLATRVVAQVRQAFGVELPVRSLFESPTLFQLAAEIDTLKAGGSLTSLTPIQPIERTGALPLSDAQRRQWVLAQLEPESPFYIIPTAVRVKGDLSIDRLQQSLAQMIERHEVLRTKFIDWEGQAVIAIQAEAAITIPVVDLSGLDQAQQQAQIREQLQREARTPFDLSQAPLLRIRVLRLAALDQVVVLCLHHIIADGWSMGILVQELAQTYDTSRSGRAAELPPLPLQYVDYAAWQQQPLPPAQLDYWQQQLQGAPPLLELPTDQPHPAVQSLAGATAEFQLSIKQTQALEQLSQQQGVTLFMTLLAAFQVLLQRYSGCTDLVIGTPIANRPQAELEGLIGMFVNTLVLRTDLSGDPRFEELLRRVREVTLDAYAHQSVPFEQVVEALAVPRSWSHAPLFQVMFVLQNAPLPPMAMEGLEWEPLVLESGTAKFDLTLSMRPTHAGLKGVLEYRTDLFEADTIQRMAGHFCTLLAAICEQPSSRIAELPLLTAAERSQFWQWHQTQTDYPRHLCIHELFEQQVEKTPAATALIFRDQSFTYQALNESANQLAWYLRSHLAAPSGASPAIAPDTLIGLWAERCPATMVAMLAILKAGGAYVPLDPNYPPERLQFMIEDAGLSLVITPQAIHLSLDQIACQSLALNAEAVTIAQQSTANLPTSTTAENLAYVLYTSGSTGQPKGVCTPHRGVVRLVKDTDYVEFGPSEVFLQAASLSFDASTFEIWGALLNGGQLVLMPTPVPTLDELAEAIAQHQVTTLWLTAGLFHLMVDEQIDALRPVRQLLAGGDVLSGAHVRKALSQLPHTRLINGYGPTENTTFSCCHTLTADSLNHTTSADSPPIGRPIANTQVYVLDDTLQPVPIGVPGELYLGGDGLARGYLHRPDLTAERFVPNPFYGKAEGNREQGIGNEEQRTKNVGLGPCEAEQLLYKTGDRVRTCPDGVIEFLGRLDNQVKIRGFRIELGEIEAALLSHPDVEQAIVRPWQDDTGRQQLVAYVVEIREQGLGNREQAEAESVECSVLSSQFDTIQTSTLKTQNSSPPLPHSPSPQPLSATLRQFLADQLPAYMLPAAFVELASLPLTSNGKVDRQSLPDPTWESETTGELPQMPVEQTLAAIWAAVLRLETVGVQDNFFELGGDSILALQMVSRAAQAGLSLSPRQIFQHQTIAELATVAETTAAIATAPMAATGAVPLTPIQQWFFEQNLEHPYYFNQAVYLELPLGSDRRSLDQAIQQVAGHHDALRLRFERTATGWQQGYAEASRVEPITWYDLSSLAEGDQVREMATQAQALQASLHLKNGPLMRVGGFDLGAERPSRLLIVLHHLVVDGLSWRILLEDLLSAYRQGIHGLNAQLPAKTQSFQQWAIRLQAATQQAEATLPYWQTLPTATPLPLDHNAGDNTVAAADTVTVSLSRQSTQALLQTVPLTYRAEITDVLLTALMQVLTDWTGHTSHLLTLENHGRHPEELGHELNLSRTVGWFTCLYPVALQLTAAPPDEQLQAIKAQLRQVPHRGLSYGLLRYGVGRAELARSPQISFNYLGQFDGLLAEAKGFCLLETPVATRDGQQQRSHLIDINGSIRQEQLQMAWTYSRHHHHRATLEALAHQYMQALQQLIEGSQSAIAPAYSPADFSLVELDQATLEAVLGGVTFQGGGS